MRHCDLSIEKFRKHSPFASVDKLQVEHEMVPHVPYLILSQVSTAAWIQAGLESLSFGEILVSYRPHQD